MDTFAYLAPVCAPVVLTVKTAFAAPDVSCDQTASVLPTAASNDGSHIRFGSTGVQEGSAVGLITTEYACEVVVAPLVTCTVKLYVAALDGVPLRLTLAPLVPSESPVGSVPLLTLHVNGPVVVPTTLSDCE